jgi:hypothetical protein
MNRVETVVKLAEKVRPYVDEIVIIDSSKKENHQSLKNSLNMPNYIGFLRLGCPNSIISLDWIFVAMSGLFILMMMKNRVKNFSWI